MISSAFTAGFSPLPITWAKPFIPSVGMGKRALSSLITHSSNRGINRALLFQEQDKYIGFVNYFSICRRNRQQVANRKYKFYKLLLQFIIQNISSYIHIFQGGILLFRSQGMYTHTLHQM